MTNPNDATVIQPPPPSEADLADRARRVGDQPAFPFYDGPEGMSYRQWLIGQALAGVAGAYARDENMLPATLASMAVGAAEAVLLRLVEIGRDRPQLKAVPQLGEDIPF